MTTAALRARVARLRGYDAHGQSPDRRSEALAARVLQFCQKDLGLPDRMRLEWRDSLDAWGEVSSAQPHVVRLNRQLLDDPLRLIETIAHESMHARRCLDGFGHDDHEQDARRYGQATRQKFEEWTDGRY